MLQHNDRNRPDYMIISHSHQFAFVHIHKTAGESVSAALAPVLTRRDLLIDGGPTYALRRQLLPRYRRARHLHKHSPAAAIRDHLGVDAWASLYSFAVVRDPLERAFSLYRYLNTVVERSRTSLLRQVWYHTPGGRAANPESWSAVRALHETTTFGEFLRHPNTLADPGFQPQIAMLDDRDGARLVTRTIRLERLADDFAEVQEELGLHPRVALPHQNASKAPAIGAHRDAVTDDDRAFVASRFEADYATLGYPLPPSRC